MHFYPNAGHRTQAQNGSDNTANAVWVYRPSGVQIPEPPRHLSSGPVLSTRSGRTAALCVGGGLRVVAAAHVPLLVHPQALAVRVPRPAAARKAGTAEELSVAGRVGAPDRPGAARAWITHHDAQARRRRRTAIEVRLRCGADGISSRGHHDLKPISPGASASPLRSERVERLASSSSVPCCVVGRVPGKSSGGDPGPGQVSGLAEISGRTRVIDAFTARLLGMTISSEATRTVRPARRGSLTASYGICWG